jgi:hypothetical protein
MFHSGFFVSLVVVSTRFAIGKIPLPPIPLPTLSGTIATRAKDRERHPKKIPIRRSANGDRESVWDRSEHLGRLDLGDRFALQHIRVHFG